MSLKELFEQKLSPQAYYPVDNNGVMLYFPKMQEAVSSENDLLGIHLAVEYTLKSVCIDRARIVCFGNNLYGREVNYIWDNFPKIHIDLLMCSPEARIIKDGDKKILKRKMEEVKKHHDTTTVYASDLPPTLRSCILYKEDEPMLCCVQHYLLSVGDSRRPTFTGRGNPCVIACHDGQRFNLRQYVDFCETEFLRLQDSVYRQ